MLVHKYFHLFFSIFLTYLSAHAEPGGWVSSGGEVFKTAKNPWFVKNTKDVYYCIQFSAPEFSVSAHQVQKEVEAAFIYWKTELQSSAFVTTPGLPVAFESTFELATQNFTYRSSCLGDEDLIFKFGYDHLDSEEINFLKDPRKYVGVTLRKAYDEVLLKGSGIIYISGDYGPHSYALTSNEVISKAWSYPHLLRYAITHELGHVFGIPHSGSGLMSEVFLDQLLIRKFAALFSEYEVIPFAQPVAKAEICQNVSLTSGNQKFIAGFFGLTAGQDCLKMERLAPEKNYKIFTKKMTDPATAWNQIGTLFLDQNEISQFAVKPVSLLQLPEVQTVFNSPDKSFLVGPLVQNMKVDGHINFGKSLKPYPVQVDLSPEGFIVYAVHNAQLRQVFSYGQPLLYLLMNPFF